MSAPVIIGGALVVGVGYLWWKKQQAAATNAAVDDCDKLCAIAAPIESKVAGSQGVPVSTDQAGSLCKLSPAYLLCKLLGGGHKFECPAGTVQAEDHRGGTPLHTEITDSASSAAASGGNRSWMYATALQLGNYAKGVGTNNLAVSVCIPAKDATPPVIIGTGVQTAVNCDAVRSGAPFTWDPSNGGFWRRKREGEVVNLGPCDTTKAIAAIGVQHAIMLK